MDLVVLLGYDLPVLIILISSYCFTLFIKDLPLTGFKAMGKIATALYAAIFKIEDACSVELSRSIQW